MTDILQVPQGERPAVLAQDVAPAEAHASLQTRAALGYEQIIEAVYRAFLGRGPDGGGLRYHTAMLQADGLEAVIKDAIASSEF